MYQTAKVIIFDSLKSIVQSNIPKLAIRAIHYVLTAGPTQIKEKLAFINEYREIAISIIYIVLYKNKYNEDKLFNDCTITFA